VPCQSLNFVSVASCSVIFYDKMMLVVSSDMTTPLFVVSSDLQLDHCVSEKHCSCSSDDQVFSHRKIVVHSTI